jgi:AraC-like DNA-binding protein
MSRPVDVLRAAHDLLSPDGAVIVVDERAADAFIGMALDNPIERFLYAVSTTVCLPNSLAEQPSAAIGTVIRSSMVERLAREAGLSRSGLAERFTRVIGVAPMRYLAEWRLQVAGQKLKDSNDPLVRIAEQVGYESEAAFSRAFKKKFGAAPATWRRA